MVVLLNQNYYFQFVQSPFSERNFRMLLFTNQFIVWTNSIRKSGIILFFFIFILFLRILCIYLKFLNLGKMFFNDLTNGNELRSKIAICLRDHVPVDFSFPDYFLISIPLWLFLLDPLSFLSFFLYCFAPVLEDPFTRSRLRTSDQSWPKLTFRDSRHPARIITENW